MPPSIFKATTAPQPITRFRSRSQSATALA
jgi:hypothetical protein